VPAVVTGGTGFLGSHLVRLLQERGLAVRVLLRPGTSDKAVPAGIETRVGDIRDVAALQEAFAGASTVFHLAGLTAPYGPRHRYLEVNVDGTAAVLDACLTTGVDRLVHVSSMVVLGIECDRRGLTEDAPYATEFVSAYEESKVKAEQLVRARVEATGLPAVILRPGMGWGPRDRVMFPALIRAMEFPFFFMVGSGRNTLDLSYAGNIAHALWLAATRAEAVGRIYNVADGYGITCRRYLTAIATAVGLPVPRWQLPRGLVQFLMRVVLPPEPEPKDVTRPSHGHLLRMCALFRDSEPDTSRIRKELGYEPPVDFAGGVAETVAWYRQAFPAGQTGPSGSVSGPSG
jgi:nucleoside-diphosphate-sugar epimerase